ncbi:MAG TPA: hypothetical protein VI216_10110 [Candidatus Acidoferrales bacterium]
MKIQEIEQQLEQEPEVQEILKKFGFLRDGYTFSVRLHGESRDKRRTSVFEKYWKPETDSICIRFKPIAEQSNVVSRPEAHSTSVAPNDPGGTKVAPPTGPTFDLIRALDRAESRPGYNFVALKWFRDTALLLEGFSWANADTVRKGVLSDAINRRLILTNPVSNPKNPQFPVTAIRLNRLMPEVKAILGTGGESVPDFHPAQIRGENLSATILRDRR